MDSKPPAFFIERPAWVHRREWSNPYRYINSLLLGTVDSLLAQARPAAGARLLDFGCGDAPYRGRLPDSIVYLGADLPGNPKAQLALDDRWRVPLPEADVDIVLSTQVLEHVADPARYLDEARRLLKPGGHLLLTTHGLMIYHKDPVDYWRWTHEGLARIVEQAGFRIERFEGLMGLSAVAVQLFQDATLRHVPRLLRRPYAGVLQSIASAFDRLHSSQSRARNALVFAVLARKPA